MMPPLTEPHAVRWIVGRTRIVTKYTKWHWTDDANTTLCGRHIEVIGGGMLPECDDMQERVTCLQCKHRLSSRN